MSIFRVEKTRNYTVMSNYHLREKDMSLKAKGLLSWMLSNDDCWDYSIAGIVSNCKENETAIKTTLIELENFGYLKRIKHFPDSNNSKIWYEYIIYEQPIGFLGVENQEVENPLQINTKTINTKNNKTNSKELVQNSNSNNFLGSASKKQTNKSLYSKCTAMIDVYCLDVKLNSLLKQYLNLRLEMKEKPIYANQWKGLLNKLDELADKNDYETKIKIVQQSIEKGYASFYPIATTTYKKKDVFSQGSGLKSDQMNEQELEHQKEFIRDLKSQGKKTEF